MPQTCTICRHARRTDIEKAIIRGDTLRDIVRQFHLSKDAVGRHKADHLPRTLGKALEEREAARAYDPPTEMLRPEADGNLDKQSNMLFKGTSEEGDWQDAPGAISEGGTLADTKEIAGRAMLLPKAARDERQPIIQAFQRLGIPRETWSQLVGPDPIVNNGGQLPGDPFRPPAFNPYEQTPDEWRRLAHAELDEYLDEFLKSCQACVNIGLDEPVELPKQR